MNKLNKNNKIIKNENKIIKFNNKYNKNIINEKMIKVEIRKVYNNINKQDEYSNKIYSKNEIELLCKEYNNNLYN